MLPLKLMGKKGAESEMDEGEEAGESEDYEGGAGKMAAEKLASLLKAEKPDGAAILEQMKTCMEYAQEE
jgi:hypothetical protein